MSRTATSKINTITCDNCGYTAEVPRGWFFLRTASRVLHACTVRCTECLDRKEHVPKRQWSAIGRSPVTAIPR